MKKHYILNLILLVALCAAYPVQAAKTYELSYNPTIGETHRYKLEMITDMDMGSMMSGITSSEKAASMSKMTVTHFMTIEESVTEVNENGNLVNEIKYVDSEMKMKIGDKEIPNQAGEMLKNKVIKLEMTPHGEMIKCDIGDDQMLKTMKLDEMIEGFHVPFPNKKIAIGDTWTDKNVKANKLPMGITIAVQETTTYKAVGTEKVNGRNCLKLELNTDLAMIEEVDVKKMTETSEKIEMQMKKEAGEEVDEDEQKMKKDDPVISKMPKLNIKIQGGGEGVMYWDFKDQVMVSQEMKIKMQILNVGELTSMLSGIAKEPTEEKETIKKEEPKPIEIYNITKIRLDEPNMKMKKMELK